MREATSGVPNSNSHNKESKDCCKSLREGSGLMHPESTVGMVENQTSESKTQKTIEKKKS